MDPIYLDNNATTPLDPLVVEAMHEAYQTAFANPSSQHRAGQKARTILENARDMIAQILHIDVVRPRGDRLVFTSGGTEANNLAVLGLATDRSKRVCISAIEHPSVLGAAEELKRRNFTVDYLAPESSGHCSKEALATFLNSSSTQTQLAAIMLGNNETGALQPIRELADLCRVHGAFLHTDATQAVGKIDVNFNDLNVATLSFAAHKFHGPRGIGAVAVRSGVALRPILFGGNQQLGFRPGTEPVALVVGMAKALEIWLSERDKRETHLRSLTNLLESQLREDETIVINTHNPSLPHTLNLSFPGIDRQALLLALDFAGVSCSTGSACASGPSEPSHVLVAMSLSDDVISSSIRLSLGANNTKEEVIESAKRILLAVKHLRKQ